MTDTVFDPTGGRSIFQRILASTIYRWIVRIAVVVTISLACTSIFAIDPDEGTFYQDPWSVPVLTKEEAARDQINAAEVIGKVVGQMMAAITSIAESGALTQTGVLLMVMFAAIKIVWSVPANLLSGRGSNQAFADIAITVVLVGVGGFAISAGFAESLVKTIGQLGSIVAKSVASKSFSGMEELDGHGDVVQFLSGFMSNVMNIFAVLPDWDNYKLSESPQFVINVLLWAISFVILMACTAIAVGTLIVAHAVVAFGCCFAPVFIACGTWKPTTGLFNAWMRYLIAGAFTKVCVTIMAMVVSLAISNLAKLNGKLSGGEVVSMGTYAAILLIAIFSAYLMSKASNIAGDMIGATTLGGDGVLAPAMGAARGTGRAATGTAKQAKSIANGVHGASVSIGQGASLGYTNDANSIGDTKGGMLNAAGRVTGFGLGTVARGVMGGPSGSADGGPGGASSSASTADRGASRSSSQGGGSTAGLAAAGQPAGNGSGTIAGSGSAVAAQANEGASGQGQGAPSALGSHPAFSAPSPGGSGSGVGANSMSNHPAFSGAQGAGSAPPSASIGSPGSHSAFAPQQAGGSGSGSGGTLHAVGPAGGGEHASAPMPPPSTPPMPSPALPGTTGGKGGKGGSGVPPAAPPRSALSTAFLGKRR